MANKINIQTSKKKLKLKIEKTRVLVKTAMPFQTYLHQEAKYHIGPKYIQQIIGLAFLSIMATWEDFLSEILLKYMCSHKFIHPSPITCKIPNIPNMDIAKRIVMGGRKFNNPNSYLDYTNLQDFKNDVNTFLNNIPFAIEKDDIDLIKHASTIRNRVAHESEKCKNEFISLLQIHSNTNKNQGYNPGMLLLNKDIGTSGLFTPKQLGNFNTKFNLNNNHYIEACVFEVFMVNLEELADRFIP